MSKPTVEIRPNDDGSIDEIVALRCNLHIEQMSGADWYLGVEGEDGSYWQFWLGSKNGRSHVEARCTEMIPAEEMIHRIIHPEPPPSPDTRGTSIRGAG